MVMQNMRLYITQSHTGQFYNVIIQIKLLVDLIRNFIVK